MGLLPPLLLQVSNRAKELVSLLQNPDRIRCARRTDQRQPWTCSPAVPNQPACPTRPSHWAGAEPDTAALPCPTAAPSRAERAKAKSLKDKFRGASREDMSIGAGMGGAASSGSGGAGGASTWASCGNASGPPGLPHQGSLAQGDDGHLGERCQALGGEARPGKVRRAVGQRCMPLSSELPVCHVPARFD